MHRSAFLLEAVTISKCFWTLLFRHTHSNRSFHSVELNHIHGPYVQHPNLRLCDREFASSFVSPQILAHAWLDLLQPPEYLAPNHFLNFFAFFRPDKITHKCYFAIA